MPTATEPDVVEVVQAYQYALDLTPSQEALAWSHVGGKRFAYNHMLALVKANLEQRSAEKTYGIPDEDLTPMLNWSAWALRKHWNEVKPVVAPWWPANSKETYASACQSLANALGNFHQSRTGQRSGAAVKFPRFKKRNGRQSVTFTTGGIRVEPDRHHVTLPKLGRLKTHESTRKLARRVENGTARITQATLSYTRGRWMVAFTVHVLRKLARPAHVGRREPVVGVDLGVKDYLVVATPDGREVERIPAPRELRTAQSTLRKLQRKASRQVGPYDPATKKRREASAGWHKTQAKLQKAHARVANLREDRIRKTTTRLAQSYDYVAVESLAVKNMMAKGGSRKRGLNRAIGDASFGETLRQLKYKTTWYGSQLIEADRWYPSSKTCSGCGRVKAKLTLAERTYTCNDCGVSIDRDLNAAVNLARLAEVAWLEQKQDSGGAPLGGAHIRPPSPATSETRGKGVEAETPPRGERPAARRDRVA